MGSTLGLIVCFLFFSQSDGTKLLDQPYVNYKNTLVLYGVGRRSERDLPVCQEANEACNLVHTRVWLIPITERLCRCPRRAQCPINYVDGRPPTSQHVTNRAQLKFCEGLDRNLKVCSEETPALEVIQKGGESDNTRTTLSCRCPWPYFYQLNNTLSTTTTSNNKETQNLVYFCKELPKCETWDTCGHIRQDTYEVYYTCSCPINHLCVFKEPFTNSTKTARQLGLLHFGGRSFEAVCTPKYSQT